MSILVTMTVALLITGEAAAQAVAEAATCEESWSGPVAGERFFQAGQALRSGDGGHPADLAKAAACFRRAAELGHARASWIYGKMRYRGEGVDKNPAEAWIWVKRSAEAGDVDGQLDAGAMLTLGENVAKDEAAARVWFRRAAERGSARGLMSLGWLMMRGRGGPVEEVRGQAYVEMAREGGDAKAAEVLNKAGFLLTIEERRQAEEIKMAWKRKFGDPR